MPGRRLSDIDGLRERERIAVDFLARGCTNREISRQLNVSERTVYNWRRKPRVQRAVYLKQQEMLDSGGGQGLSVMPQAIQTLVEIMNDPEARAADRIAASRALLNGTAAFQERKLLERTVSDLEAQIYGLINEPTESAAVDPTSPSEEEELLAFLPSADPDDAYDEDDA